MQNLAQQYANANVAATPTPTPTPTVAATPTTTALGSVALYAKAQAAKAQAQAQRLANATYVLIKPGKANLSRVKPGITPQQQAQVNANFAATLVLQLYPLVAASGLTPQQQTQVQQHLLQSVYTLQQAAAIPATKQAVQLQLPPL